MENSINIENLTKLIELARERGIPAEVLAKDIQELVDGILNDRLKELLTRIKALENLTMGRPVSILSNPRRLTLEVRHNIRHNKN